MSSVHWFVAISYAWTYDKKDEYLPSLLRVPFSLFNKHFRTPLHEACYPLACFPTLILPRLQRLCHPRVWMGQRSFATVVRGMPYTNGLSVVRGMSFKQTHRHRGRTELFLTASSPFRLAYLSLCSHRDNRPTRTPGASCAYYHHQPLRRWSTKKSLEHSPRECHPDSCAELTWSSQRTSQQ